MKWLLILFTLLSFHSIEDLTVMGTYQGSNLYVQNPMVEEGFDYCTDSVRVNNYILTSGFSAGAYEIKLDTMQFVLGGSINLIIYHKSGCKPKILQSDHRMPTKNVFVDFQLNGGLLEWSSEKSARGVFIVQFYRWNKWANIAEVHTNDQQKYSVPVKDLGHSGVNQVRVKLKEGQNNVEISETVKFTLKQSKVEMTYNKKKQTISFSAETSYELYDDRGNMVKRGRGVLLNCMKCKKGVYFLNFDNENQKVVIQ